MHRFVTLSVSIMVSLALHAWGLGPVPPNPPNPQRIAEIAETLKDDPEICSPDIASSRWNPVKGKSLVQRLAAAEKIAGSAIPAYPNDLYLDYTRNGNRTRYQDWCEDFFSKFDVLVSAERSEKKGRFLKAIAERLDAMASWQSWTLPAHDSSLENYNGKFIHIDLRSALLSRYLGEALMMFEGKLPETTVSHVRSEVQRRVFDPYLTMAKITDFKKKSWQRRNYWFFCANNWNAVCHSECVRSALALIKDRNTRAMFIEAAERGLDFYFSGFPKDGYCSEGMGYWNYGYGNYLLMGLAVRKATGGKVDFFSHPRAYAAMRYPIQFQLQKKISPHFADGGGNPVGSYINFGCQVWPDLKDEALGKLPVRSEFPDGQVWISRLSPDAERPLSIAFKGGHNNEQHNHNDIGSWTVMFDGQEIVCDPGAEVYTSRTFSKDRYQSDVLNSYGHPVPRVGGKLQSTGRKFAAKVLSTKFTESCDIVSLDIAGAYECDTLTSLVRTFVFDRTKNMVSVTDKAVFSRPTEFDDPLITYCDVVADYVPDRLRLIAEKGVSANVSVSVKGGAWTWNKSIIDNPTRRSPKRLAVAFDAPVASAEVTFVLSFAM